jgi:hypothetical protein
MFCFGNKEKRLIAISVMQKGHEVYFLRGVGIKKGGGVKKKGGGKKKG